MLGQILWNLKKENINNIIENIPDKNDYNYNDLISIFKDINDDFNPDEDGTTIGELKELLRTVKSKHVFIKK